MRTLLLLSLIAWLPLRAADWQSLFDGQSLAGWRIAEFAGHGDVEVAGGVVVLNQGTLTGINYTNPTPTVDYEVEWEARRTQGLDFFSGLTFPVKDTFATLICGGWGGAVVGISSINGNDASRNETTSYHRFKKDQWYRFRLAVTATNLGAWIDGERVVNADITGKTITLRSGEIELSKPFGFATWSTTAELRGIRLRKLEAAPKAGAAAEASAYRLPDTIVTAAGRLITAATNSDFAYRRLAELCDTFGPRFTGSTNLEAAIDWILAQMRADGFDTVRGEPVMVPRWVRGSESVELLKPRREPLPMLGLGGSIGTPWGGITAPVFVVHSVSELTNHAREAAGKIVVFDVPYTDYGETVAIRVNGAVHAAKVGAKASLIRSITPFALRTPHTGVMAYETNVTKIPHAALAPEDTARFARWQERGITPVVRLKMSAKTLKDVPSRNVVAELRGREKPDEVIVIGGHVDSWDVGQGAQDDGGGCLAAWEAVRLMKQLGLRPRRTVRVVLWTNEETGGAGAKAYHKAHLAEMPKHVAALETDIGTFAPEGFGFTGSTKANEIIRAIGGLLGQRLQAGKIVLGAGAADVAPLLQEGVPSLGMRVDRTRYFWYHHTAADTVDKVDPYDLGRCTATLAVMVYALAELEEPLPR